MIFYFSATGNSKWIAETVAKALGDKAEDLTKADPHAYHFTENDSLGIVFPVYFCEAPHIVKEFADKLDPDNAYTYAICNFSNYTGAALEQFSREDLHLNAGYGLLMPDNSTVMGFSYDTEESAIEKLKAAPDALNKFIDMIKERKTGIFNDYEGEDPEKSTVEIGKLAEPYSVTSPFHVDKERCVHCGLCEKICSAHAISLSDGVPVWVKDHCNICLACINRCPAEAIQYGDKSQNAFRYTFDKFIKRVQK